MLVSCDVIPKILNESVSDHGHISNKGTIHSKTDKSVVWGCFDVCPETRLMLLTSTSHLLVCLSIMSSLLVSTSPNYCFNFSTLRNIVCTNPSSDNHVAPGFMFPPELDISVPLLYVSQITWGPCCQTSMFWTCPVFISTLCVSEMYRVTHMQRDCSLSQPYTGESVHRSNLLDVYCRLQILYGTVEHSPLTANGSRFEPAGWPGPFCLGFLLVLPHVCVGFLWVFLFRTD